MKKYIILVIAFLVFAMLPIGVFAQNGQGDSNQNQEENQNQIQTQNQGEEQNLTVTSQEQENEANQSTSSTQQFGQGRSETGQAHMSQVATRVQELLQIREESGEQSGLGEKVRIVAQEQVEIESRIQEQVDNLSKRKGLVKFFLGPDYLALNDIEMQMEQNRLQVQNLTQMKTETNNAGGETTIQNMIQALNEQNIQLQEQINQESKTFSLFGWLARLFI